MGAGCEIELEDGRNCGVTAIGRCTTCGRAFCTTHQGRAYNVFNQLIPNFDICAPCLFVKQAEEAKRATEARAPYDYFMSDAARKELLASRVQPVNIDQIGSVWKTGFFGLGGRYVEVTSPFAQGWILGEFKWQYSIPVGRDSETVKKNWLTALLSLSPDDHRLYTHSMYNRTLVRVRPYSRGYELVLGSFDRFVGEWESGEGWREAAEAVKRLIGN